MKITTHWPGVTKHLIALALGWCLLSILLGLFYAFDAMETSAATTPSVVVPYFLKVTAISFVVGLIVLGTPVLIWKLLNNDRTGK